MILLSALSNVPIPGGFWAFIWSQMLLGSWSPLSLISYGWAVVIFTVFLKLLLSPLDIWQRVSMRKNQKITESIRPEVEKLEKTYASQPRILQKKKQELNKKSGIKMLSGCLPMIVTMVVSIWLLMGGLNPISQHQQMVQYLQLFDAYSQAELYETVQIAREGDNEDKFIFYDENGYEMRLSDATEDRLISRAVLRPVDAVPFAFGDYLANPREAIEARNEFDAMLQRRVGERGRLATSWRFHGAVYEDIEEQDRSLFNLVSGGLETEGRIESVQVRFLWVRNIWVADVPWSAPLRDANAFLGGIGAFRNVDRLGLEDRFTQEQFDREVIGAYDRVMGHLVEEQSGRANGFLILPILSIAVMLASSILMRRLQKKSGQAGGMPGMPGMGGMAGRGGGKIMTFVMPIVFGLFSLGFTAAFALYMIVNSLFTTALTLVFMGITKAIDKKKVKAETAESGAVHYGRLDPTQLGEKKGKARNKGDDDGKKRK